MDPGTFSCGLDGHRKWRGLEEFPRSCDSVFGQLVVRHGAVEYRLDLLPRSKPDSPIQAGNIQVHWAELFGTRWASSLPIQ